MVRTCTPRALMVCALAVSLMGSMLHPSGAQAQTEHAYVDGEVILKFAPGATPSEIQAVVEVLQAVEETPLNSIGARVYRIQTPVEEAVETLSADPVVEYIEPNYLWYAEEIPNDPSFGQLWGLHNTGQTGGTPGADISAVEAWDVFQGSPDVVVAVIDTGVDIGHPDLADNIFYNPGEIPGNGVDDDGNGFIDDVNGWDFANNDNDPADDVGHGTHVSGTIGAVGNNGIGVVGVNWDVEIMPIKFLAPGGGTTANAIASVNYATLMGVDIMSNSWGGGPYSVALEAAIAAASDAGILFVASAGNSGLDTDVFPHYPSNYDVPNVVSVAATDHNDLLAGFSNYGLVTVDLGAPGVDVLSTVPGAGYATASGTSMAAPHVSGVFALMKGVNPTMPMLAMKDYLLTTADPLPSLAGRVATGARLNAFDAIAEPDSIPPAPVDDLEVLEVTSSNGIRLRWTATGDDGYDGTASYYDVRFADFFIDESNFDLADQADGAPDPSPPGSVEEFVVQGLDFDTSYYLALKVLDEFGNASLVSNVVTAMTLSAPDITVSPASFSEALLTGASSTQVLTIENQGGSDLAFELSAVLLQTAGASKAPVDGPWASPRESDPASLALDETAGGPLELGTPIAPDFAPPVILFDDFEDGDFDGWLDGGGPWLKEVTSATAAAGTNYSYHDTDGIFDHFYGKYQDMGAVQPAYISFYIRSASTSASDAYVVLRDSNGYEVIWFFARGNGFLYVNADVGGSESFVYAPNTWYHVELREIDFTAKTFDFYVDGTLILAGIPFRNAAFVQDLYRVDIYNFSSAEAWWDEIIISEQPYVPWLSLDPVSGVVPVGGAAEVDVTFDATGLVGGGYDADIFVNSNDPDEPEVQVPAHLDVTGAPDIDVNPTSLDFGVVFLGLVAEQTLTVCNPGTDLLQVSSISSGDPLFSAEPTAFDLSPGACQEVVVSFSPITVGTYVATLSITSNDPDETVVAVPLRGEGAECPVITVNPTEIVSNLLTNEVEIQTLEVGNVGGSDLEFAIGIQTPQQLVTLTAPTPSGTTFDGAQVPSNPIRTTALQAELSDLTGMDILWDLSRGQPSSIDWSIMVSDLTTRGATFTENFDTLTPALLADFDVLWSTDVISAWSASEMAAITSWVQSGGSLLLEGDNSSTVVAFNSLLASLGAGIQLLDVPGASGYTTLIEPHPTTENVAEIVLDANIAQISSITSPAGLLVSDVAGVPASAYSEVGQGRILAVTDETFFDGRMGLADNQLWGNQVFDWFQGARWITVEPAEGVVPPQGILPLDVTLDATGLFGGVYELDLVVSSNDCLSPEVIVPATLTVTGRPDLGLSDSQLDFGTIFYGGTKDLTLVVSNIGTDLLTVTSIAVDDPAFLVDSTPFDLLPRESRELVVTYSPTVLGPAYAVLSLESNDPDGTETVALSGMAVEPPDIDVTPTSFTEALFSGETSVQTLTISNLGVAPLEFALETEEVALVGAKSGSGQLGNLREYEVTGLSGVNRPGEDGAAVMGATYTYGAVPENVLVYADDYRTPPGGNYVDLALQNLDISYTAYYSDPPGFETALTTGEWDLVVIDNNNYFLGSQLWDAVETFVLDGGRVLISTFYIDDTVGLTNLWTTLGVDFQQDYTSVQPVFWWEPAHRLFNSPESVPEFTQMVDDYLDNGDEVDPLPAASAVAGFSATASPAQGGIVLTATGTSVVNSFLVVENNEDLDQDGTLDAVELFMNEILYLSRFVPWLLPDPPSGTVQPGESVDIQVTFDATGLIGGAYDANLLVNSNDPDEPVVTVPAHLDVTGAPDIVLSDTAFDFGTVYLSAAATANLTVSNEGTDVLSVTSIVSSDPDFTVDVSAFEVAVGASQNVEITFAPSRTGVIAGGLVIDSNDPLDPQVTVVLAGVGAEPPDIAVSPASFDLLLPPGSSTTRTLTIENTGASDLIFDVGTFLPQGAAAKGEGTGTPAPGSVPDGALATSQGSAPQEDLGPARDLGEPVPANVVAGVTLQDNFEDGDYAGWIAAGASSREVTSATAAAGTQYSYHEYNSVPGHFNGVYQDMGAVQPAYISFWMRSGSRNTHDSYFVLRDSGGLNVVVFYADASGFFSVNLSAGGSRSFSYTAETWYHIEFIDIDFAAKNFDFYVDGQPVHFNIPFQNAAASDMYRVDLYNYTTGSQAWWDEIYISTTPFVDWLSVDPTSGVVPPGGAAEIVVTADATELAVGPYDAEIGVQSNDPDEPSISIPVHLDVVSATDVVMMTMGDAAGLGGATVMVPLTLSRPNPAKMGDPSQTAGLDVVVDWDPAIASLVNVHLTEATGDWLMEFNATTGSVDVSMATVNPIDVPVGGVEFLMFEFQLAEVEGVTPLAIVDSRLFDLMQAPIDHVTVDGSLTAGCEKGDVIPDGEVNSADAIRGLLIAMDLVAPTPQEFCAADMNLDGAVDVGDVVLILAKAVGSVPAGIENLEPARLFARAGAEIGDVILHVENVAGLDVLMTYDPSAVSFVSASAPGSEGLTASNTETPGTLRVGFARATAYEGDITLKFDVVEPHSTLTLQEAVGYDEAGVKRPVELSTNEFIFGVTGIEGPALGRSRLLAAVPNPFNPMTQLRFVLSNPGDAKLTVFNVAGRRVREFQLRGLPAGQHFVRWDGRDDAGARVASGAYLIRFESGETTDTGRVLLLK